MPLYCGDADRAGGSYAAAQSVVRMKKHTGSASGGYEQSRALPDRSANAHMHGREPEA